jgi:hypothetical protein
VREREREREKKCDVIINVNKEKIMCECCFILFLFSSLINKSNSTIKKKNFLYLFRDNERI